MREIEKFAGTLELAVRETGTILGSKKWHKVAGFWAWFSLPWLQGNTFRGPSTGHLRSKS